MYTVHAVLKMTPPLPASVGFDVVVKTLCFFVNGTDIEEIYRSITCC